MNIRTDKIWGCTSKEAKIETTKTLPTKVEVIVAFDNGFQPTPIYWRPNICLSKKIRLQSRSMYKTVCNGSNEGTITYHVSKIAKLDKNCYLFLIEVCVLLLYRFISKMILCKVIILNINLKMKTQFLNSLLECTEVQRFRKNNLLAPRC